MYLKIQNWLQKELCMRKIHTGVEKSAQSLWTWRNGRPWLVLRECTSFILGLRSRADSDNLGKMGNCERTQEGGAFQRHFKRIQDTGYWDMHISGSSRRS